MVTTTHPVTRLDHRDRTVAGWILDVQRAAYRREATLVGSDRIPPLHETVEDIVALDLEFLGVLDADGIAGVIAFRRDDEHVDVDRLMVAPRATRRGVGGALVAAALDGAGPARATVSTGRDNVPGRRLYERFGFHVVRERTVDEGLVIVEMERDAEPADTRGTAESPGAAGVTEGTD